MSWAIAVILAIAFSLIAGFSYARLPRRGGRILLWGIRCALLLALLGAFIQPAFTFNRLAGHDNTVAVIVDNSRSMRLFNAQQGIEAVTRIARRTRTPRTRTHYLCFGDSARLARDPAGCSFDDRRSFLPAAWNDPAINEARRMIIVSDGNWSNPTLPRRLFEERDCHFFTLTKATSIPFLQIEPLMREIESASDSVVVLPVLLSGWAAHPRRISVTRYHPAGGTQTRTVRADSGYFSDTMRIPFKSGIAGRHRCIITARTDGDTSSASLSAVVIHTVIPTQFTVYTHAPVPSLDNRFLTLALAQSGLWHPATSAAQADLLILLGWDTTADSLLGRLKPKGVVLFWGCLPCGSQKTTPLSGEWYPRFDLRPEGPLPFAENSRLPAPSGVVSCTEPKNTPARRILSLIRTAGPATDTVPVITQMRIRQRTALVMAAREAWRWDFWTRPFNPDATELPFSRYLLEEAHQQVIRNTADAMITCVQNTPVQENEPLRMRVMLPAQADGATDAQVVLLLSPAGSSRTFDTTLNVMIGYDRHATAVMPPMPAGMVTCRVLLRSGNRNLYAVTDTLQILPDETEMRVMAQNTALLRQIAHEVDPRDTAQIAAIFTADAHAPQRTIRRTITIQRTWEMLAVILALLGVEWVVRRRMRLD